VCGFLFVRDLKGLLPEKLDLDHCLDSMDYRGPDYRSSITRDGCFFGHVRLSIINPLPRANQPHENEHSILLFNGEIYNYKALCPSETSDTLVLSKILHNEKKLKKIEGMYAFLHYDKSTKVISVFRDYFGEKPAYYYNANGLLIVSSTLTAIRKVTNLYDRKLSINNKAIKDYLLFGWVREPRTIYTEIQSVRRNSKITFDHVGREEKVNGWRRTKKTSTDCGEEYLRNSLLANDVDSTVFLSGGIDSAYVFSKAVDYQFSPENLSATTLCTNNEFNEGNDAKFNFEKIALRSWSYRQVKPLLYSYISQLDQLIEGLEQPTNDGFNSYSIYSAIQESSGNTPKVVYTGLGGDELFGGYSDFRFLKYRTLFTASFFSKLWSFQLSKSWKRFSISQFLPGNSVEKFYYLYRIDPRLSFYIDRNELVDNFNFFEENYSTKESDSLQCLKGLEISDYMCNNLLRDTDNISMLFGSEQRAPLLCPGLERNNIVYKKNLTHFLSDRGIKFSRKLGFNANKPQLEDLKYMRLFNEKNKSLIGDGVDFKVFEVDDLVEKIYRFIKWRQCHKI
jgi:asparagine synthase (glutamine-hydrolysing)